MFEVRTLLGTVARGLWMGERKGISRYGFAFTPAFGRVEAASRQVFRREAKASLYLAARARQLTC
ncbi:hypothetical protein GCM10011585_04350 [Edaphobacter dinghuensis]|uniref:Uncharacterized protein n=1 Tax=Edaphobacter dinghuensis TaxID=1560005 RepID=A0A917H2S9_9BACT|nr:hypothetical protein GCM10011585_04350 [Edaphobacter dinghuensis]